MSYLDDIKTKIWAKVNIRSIDECWPIHKDECGQMRYYEHRWPLSRIIYDVYVGIQNLDNFVCHTCDNGFGTDVRCCNLRHLFEASQAGNMQDCADKGRTARFNGRTIDWKTVDYIRFIRKHTSMTLQDIADDVVLSKSQVYNIVNEKQWKEENRDAI